MEGHYIVETEKKEETESGFHSLIGDTDQYTYIDPIPEKMG